MQDIDRELPKACLQNSQTCTSIGDRIQGLLEELRRKNPSGKKLMKLVNRKAFNCLGRETMSNKTEKMTAQVI